MGDSSLAKKPVPPSVGLTPARSTRDKKKVNILMVDDDPGKLLVYETVLAELDENLIRTTSASEALDKLLSNDVAVMLIDVKMPDLDGFELANLIREHPRYERTAMIFVSAVHMTDLDRLKGYERGGVDYLSVPVIPELLRAKVRVFADLHRKSLLLAEKNEQLRFLSTRLLAAQDQERRRIARNLHDSLGQYLASVQMSLDLLSPCVSPEGIAHLATALDSLHKSIVETRTISHLLHPPLLDEAGLGSAARFYVESFAQRSGIEARLDLPEQMERLPELTEVALFRILQESLTNVHRHSGSSSVEIQLKVSNSQVQLTVRDFGHGMPPHSTHGFANGNHFGVGLSGMRERINDLGGSFQVQSDTNGTAIVVSVPLPEHTAGDSLKAEGNLEKSSVA